MDSTQRFTDNYNSKNTRVDEASKLQLLALGGNKMLDQKKREIQHRQNQNHGALSNKESNFSYPHDLSESIDEDIGIS